MCELENCAKNGACEQGKWNKSFAFQYGFNWTLTAGEHIWIPSEIIHLEFYIVG
jgi:hypothetical protein